MAPGSTSGSSSLIAGSASSTSRIRPSEALPRCARLATQPIAIIGQISLPRKKLKVTYSPSVSAPRVTSRPPYQSTATKPTPTSPWIAGWKAADQAMSRRLRSTYSSLARAKSASSARSRA